MTTKDEDMIEIKTEATKGDKAKAMGNLPIHVHAQYIKDASFENPNAPQVFLNRNAGPKMNLNVMLNARGVQTDDGKELTEVALKVMASAEAEGKTMFIAEVEYAVLVSFGDDVDKSMKHPLTFIEVPRLAFPFARRALSDLVQEGGFPPLLLNPIDFNTMYQDRFAVKKADSNGKDNTAAASK